MKKKEVWRTTGIVFILACVSVLLWASDRKAEAAAQDDRVVLTIMTRSIPAIGLFEDVEREFEAENPDIDLEFITMPEADYNEALPLLFESGQAPDIFYWSGAGDVMHVLMRRGWIQPLNPDGVPQEWMDRWPPGYFISGMNIYEDEVYTFPFSESRVSGFGYLFYNREMLAAAGLDPEQPPGTWSELRDACQTIVDQAVGACIAIPTDPPGDIRRIWNAIAGSIMTSGAFDYQQGRFCLDDERLIAAYNYIRSLYDNDLVLLGGDPENPYVYNKEFARQALATGQAAFYFGGDWIPGYFSELGFEDFVDTNLGIAGPPYPDDYPRGALYTGLAPFNTYWVSSQTQHPDEAWRYLEWMTRPEGFFGTEYVARGLGFLQYVDNAQYVTDPNMLRIIEIGSTIRVIQPDPLLLNPDLAESQAYNLAAESFSEMSIVSETLLSDGDFAAVAREIAQTQNDLFLEALEEERNGGLNVSVEDYTFPDWNFDEDFDYGSYR